MFLQKINGLSSNAPSYPSFPLKEQLLNVLESKEVDLDALLKLLGVELKASQHLKTVHEVVNTYEEENGQLSLQAWETIFQGLGYSEDFLQVLAHFNEQRRCQGPAELAMANLQTGTEKKNDESGASSTDYVSPKETKTEKGGVHHYQHSVAMAAKLSDQLAIIVNELDNSALDTAAAAVKVTEGPLSPPVTQMPSSGEQPSWGLPIFSPEDTCMHSEDHLTNFSSQSSTRAPGAEVDDSGFFSVLNSDDSVMLSGDNDASSSSSSSLNSIIKTAECSTSSQTGAPMVCHERPVSEAIAPAALQTSEPLSISSQCASFTTSVSNQSNELVDSQSQSFDSICSETDQQQNETSETEEGYNAGSSFSIMSGPSISNHGSEASSRTATTFNTAACFPPAGHCNGTKNYDASGNVSLVEELQKKIEELHANVIFRVERLQNQMLICQHVQDRNSHLQQALLECRSRCARLEEQMEEFTVFLNRSTELEAESQRLIRMTQECADSKQEEYDRLQERRRIENESQAVRMSNLERKNEELQSHLVEMGIAMTNKSETIRTQQEECNWLSEECNRLREECIWLREECEWLKKEPHRLKETIRTLRMVIDQLDSQNACMIADNQTSDSAMLNCSFQSTSGERGADDVAHISGSSQHSDSGDSSDDDLFEDAVEYL